MSKTTSKHIHHHTGGIPKKLGLISFLLISLIGNALYGQEWMGKTNPTTSDFQAIQKTFYEYLAMHKHEPESKEEDGAYTKFKRWEYYWETRVDSNGHFPGADILWKAWESYDGYDGTSKRAVPSGNWVFQGPSSFVPWSRGGGIGRVNCMAFHPTLPNTFWVGTPVGGVWKTTDGGLTWSTTTDNLPVLGISDIAIDYSNPMIIYLATGDGETAIANPASTKSVGILKSTDGGVTYNPTGLSINILAQKLTNRILIHPTNPQILIVAASDGIWRTSNGGTTWTNQQTGWFMDLEFKPNDANYIYASTLSNTGTAQIFRSVNAGISWTQVTALSGINRIDLAVSPAVPTVVSALCANTTSLGGLEGIYTSSNNGASFSKVLTGTCTNNMLGRKYDGKDCGGQGVYDLAYCIHPSNTNEVWVAGINNWKTSDGGASWKLNTMNTMDTVQNPNKVPYLHSDKHRIVYHPLNPNYIFTCSDAGLHISNDGGANWLDRSNGLGISQIYRMGISATYPDKVLCGLQDNGLKLRHSTGWQEIMSGDNMEGIIDPLDTNLQYSCALTGILYKTVDNWKGASVISANIPGFNAHIAAYGLGPGAWITPFVMDPVDNKTLYMAYNDIWKTTDQGNTWETISNFKLGTQLRFMAIAPSNKQVIYAATHDTVFMTVNGGSSWNYKAISTITGNSSDKISNITISATNPSILWATIGGFNAGRKVYKSVNGGNNWTNVSGTIPNIPVNCIVYEKGSNDGIYIGTDLAVFYRDNSMSDWVPFNTGLPNVQVNDLKISSNNKLWAGTFGRGLWISDLHSTVGIHEEGINHSNISIYPNPFTKQAFIYFNKEQKNTMIRIMDISGKEIKTIVFSGTQFIIDKGEMVNGIYFVQITDENNHVVNKKIIIQ